MASRFATLEWGINCRGSARRSVAEPCGLGAGSDPVLNGAFPNFAQAEPPAFSFNSSRCLNCHSNLPLMIATSIGECAGEFVA